MDGIDRQNSIQPHYIASTVRDMQTLSRREESDILERGKKDALKACDDVVKGEENRKHHLP